MNRASPGSVTPHRRFERAAVCSQVAPKRIHSSPNPVSMPFAIIASNVLPYSERLAKREVHPTAPQQWMMALLQGQHAVEIEPRRPSPNYNITVRKRHAAR